MNRLGTGVAFIFAVISMLLIPTMLPTHQASASTCSVSGSSHGTTSTSSSNSNSCACSVVASHGMVIISGNCKPSCPPGMKGTPSTEDAQAPGGLEARAEPPGEVVHAGEVIASGSCFPSGEDEPSSMEEVGPSDPS